MMEVRTRFAPSPTGDLHVGGVRTALFAWLAAKHEGGQFFIRFEDTDQERYVPGSARKILETFDWLGIPLDGGPDHASLQKMKTNEDYAGAPDDGSLKGIPGPFVQSQRLGIYKQHAELLIANGHAYRANETPEELEQMRSAALARKESFRFKEHMRLRTDIKPDEPHVVRLKMPNDGQTRYQDLIKGEMVFENANLDDPVLLKTDGFATYHLAAMVDDHLMGVTHIIRADGWLPSAPKHVQIFKAFGWEMPKLAHVPDVLGGTVTGACKLRPRGANVRPSKAVRRSWNARHWVIWRKSYAPIRSKAWRGYNFSERMASAAFLRMKWAWVRRFKHWLSFVAADVRRRMARLQTASSPRRLQSLI